VVLYIIFGLEVLELVVMYLVEYFTQQMMAQTGEKLDVYKQMKVKQEGQMLNEHKFFKGQ
jgi:hypothetical protein